MYVIVLDSLFTEAKEFIEANTQKISEHKYLCPLSGKKFKGPEFVKKHIFNKHMDKVEAVKKEVCACDSRGLYLAIGLCEWRVISAMQCVGLGCDTSFKFCHTCVHETGQVCLLYECVVSWIIGGGNWE